MFTPAVIIRVVLIAVMTVAPLLPLASGRPCAPGRGGADRCETSPGCCCRMAPAAEAGCCAGKTDRRQADAISDCCSQAPLVEAEEAAFGSLEISTCRCLPRARAALPPATRRGADEQVPVRIVGFDPPSVFLADHQLPAAPPAMLDCGTLANSLRLHALLCRWRN